MNQPLAERLRPRSLDDYIGQLHLVGEGGVVRRMIESAKVSSFILWGPPGVGKTTLAKIIANSVNVPFYTLSAVSSGVKEVREVIERCKADAMNMFTGGRPILFIDEIHRFSKAQQDSLLGAVESGVVTLIGATTENPSFEVIRPLLSRAQVYTLRPLEEEDLQRLLERATETDSVLRSHGVKTEQTTALFRFAGGDARKLLNILDLLEQSTPQGEPVVINDRIVTDRLQENPSAYDKNGEMHYDIISAFIKSIRGSDPDAALHYLARLLEAGDLVSACRRLMVCACEDVGLAWPQIIPIVKAAVDAATMLGLPEGRIPLADAVILVATAPKSNTGEAGINAAMADLQKGRTGPIPRHLQNKHFDGEDAAVKGQHYKYPHAYPDGWVAQQYLPDALEGVQYYQWGENKTEQAAKAYWQRIKGGEKG